MENNERKLHPIIEVLIVASIILGCKIALSFVLSLYAKGKNYYEISTFLSVLNWVSLLYPVIATLLCVKVIEKRKISIVKILIVTLCVSLLLGYIWQISSSFVVSYGDQAFASFAYVRACLSPVLTAILIVIFVNILSAPKVEANMYDKKMHYGLFKHILLLLFTCGIWSLMWIYRVTRYLNCIEDEEYRSPATKLLLCMFVPFYSIYWTYKSAQRIDKLAKSVGLISDLATPCLILDIFVPIIPPILMQDKINNIVSTKIVRWDD